MVEEGEDLDGFAEAHVVGEAAAEAELPEEVEPAQSVALVGAECADEGVRRVLGVDAGEGLKLVADLLEGLVAGSVFVGAQEGVQESGLRFGELDEVVFGVADGGNQAVFLEPMLGEHAEGAVVEADRLFATAEGAQERGKLDGVAFEVDIAGKSEPVDAGGNTKSQCACAAVELAVRFDLPAFGDECVDQAGEVFLAEPELTAGFGVVERLADPQAAEAGNGLAFGGLIADDQASGLGLEDRSGRLMVEGDACTVVVEGQFGAQSLRAVLVAIRGAHPEDEFGGNTRFLDAKIIGQVEVGQIGHAQQLREQFVGLREGDGDGAVLAKDGQPDELAMIFDGGGFVSVEHNAAIEQEQRP